MELVLSSNSPRPLFEGDGGSYFFWSSSDLPSLKLDKVAAGRMLLKPGGFAPPHYVDCSKIAYVLQGSGKVGLLDPQDPKEKIVTLKKGDEIQVLSPHVSWWYNDGESDFSILFLGETAEALNPGEFTFTVVSGSMGILTGFSSDFVMRALGLRDEEHAKLLVNSQPGPLILKLKDKLPGLNSCEENIEQERKLASEILKLGSQGMLRPRYSAGPVGQLLYVIGGSGKFQVVASSGKRVLDAEVKEGFLIVVPRFMVVAAVAGQQGMELFSFCTGSRNAYGYLTGEASVLKGLSPQILGASFNVGEDQVKFFS